jgi:hypothetical protein
MSVVLVRKIDEIQHEKTLLFEKSIPDPQLRISVTEGVSYIGALTFLIEK